MTRLSVSMAAALAAFAVAAQEVPFVPGQEPAVALTDVERGVAGLAIDALAAELGIPKEKILVDTVRAVEWSDSSLGCRKPGVAYLDVVTPGHRVTLRVDRQIYVIHEARNHAFLCRENKALGGITAQHELVFGPQLLAARRDLATRIGVPEREIRFLSGEGTTWADAALGCPEPGVRYAQARTAGWVLTFGHAGRIFTYHTDLHRTIPCPPITAE